jgi:predicted transcriptional regulator
MRATTVRVADTTLARLDDLAKATGRSRSFVIQEALDRYLEHESWFVAEVQAGLREAEAGDFASESELAAFKARWSLTDDAGPDDAG